MGKLIKECEQINASKHMEISSLANKQLQIKKFITLVYQTVSCVSGYHESSL